MLFSQFLGKVKNSYPTLTAIAWSDFSTEHHMDNLSLALQLYEQYNGNIAYNTHTTSSDLSTVMEAYDEYEYVSVLSSGLVELCIDHPTCNRLNSLVEACLVAVYTYCEYNNYWIGQNTKPKQTSLNFAVDELKLLCSIHNSVGDNAVIEEFIQ